MSPTALGVLTDVVCKVFHDPMKYCKDLGFKKHWKSRPLGNEPLHRGGLHVA